jgi:rubrerythrin
MNVEDLLNKNKLLEDEVTILKEKLKNYTAPSRSKKFYENHKEAIQQKNKEYKEKTNYYTNLSSEKKKEYARTAYLNKKEKINKPNEKTELESI